MKTVLPGKTLVVRRYADSKLVQNARENEHHCTSGLPAPTATNQW
jgi:hypothetical protein